MSPTTGTDALLDPSMGAAKLSTRSHPATTPGSDLMPCGAGELESTRQMLLGSSDQLVEPDWLPCAATINRRGRPTLRSATWVVNSDESFAATKTGALGFSLQIARVSTNSAAGVVVFHPSLLSGPITHQGMFPPWRASQPTRVRISDRRKPEGGIIFPGLPHFLAHGVSTICNVYMATSPGDNQRDLSAIRQITRFIGVMTNVEPIVSDRTWAFPTRTC